MASHSSKRNSALETMDDFQESDGDESEDGLSWRLDPEQSLSDWTLVIQKQDSLESKEYHVHKNILAVGPCKSDYFASLFRTQMREAETSTSRIELEDLAADAVPNMLDFMYNPQHMLNVTSELAVSLRYLAQYFGIKLLHRRVMSFVKTDMNMSNVHLYIQSATMFHDAKMLSVASNLCIDNIGDLDVDSPLLPAIDPDFFYEIISSPEVDTCSVSCHVSTLVAAYSRIHQGDLNQETFDKLTDRRFIPLIDKESAMSLLELEAATTPTEESTTTDTTRSAGGGATTTSSSTPTTSSTTCLQKRCIKVLAQHWKDFAEQGNLPVVRSFPPKVMGELFERTLVAAKNDMEHCLKSVKAEIEKHAEVLTHKLQAAAQVVEQQVEQERNERRQLEEELEYLRREVRDRDRELAEYRREWGRMVRVPVDHTFRDIKRCTYHHESGNEPFDNPGHHHVGQFGKSRPTAMPSIGEAPDDGYLFLQKTGNYNERWPMFYYTDRK
jgi:menaquinone-dependent protoporphyrinogen IX oxidase